MTASLNGHVAIVKMLIEANAQIDARKEVFYTHKTQSQSKYLHIHKLRFRFTFKLKYNYYMQALKYKLLAWSTLAAQKCSMHMYKLAMPHAQAFCWQYEYVCCSETGSLWGNAKLNYLLYFNATIVCKHSLRLHVNLLLIRNSFSLVFHVIFYEQIFSVLKS